MCVEKFRLIDSVHKELDEIMFVLNKQRFNPIFQWKCVWFLQNI